MINSPEERDEREYKERITDLDAQCAAMREAMGLWLHLDSRFVTLDEQRRRWDEAKAKMEAALAPDAGKALLERLEKAERQAEEWRLRYDRALARAEKAEAFRDFVG